MAKKVKVSELVGQFGLEVISGEQGLKRVITVDDLYRPGLEMAGYFEYHPVITSYSIHYTKLYDFTSSSVALDITFVPSLQSCQISMREA